MSNNEFEHYKEDSSDSYDFKELIFKYIKFWPYLLLSILVFGVAAYFYNLSQPYEYKVESKLVIEHDDSGNILNLTDLPQTMNKPLVNKMANEGHRIKSRSLANTVLDKLNLEVEYYEPGAFKDIELYNSSPVKVEVDWDHAQITENYFEINWKDDQTYTLSFIDEEYTMYSPETTKLNPIELPNYRDKAYKFGQWVENPYGKFRITAEDIQSPGELKIIIRNRASLISQYTSDNLAITPVDAISSILNISLTTTVPNKGTDYLNTLLATFLDEMLAEKNAQARKTVDFIDRQISGVSDTLSIIESKLQEFRSKNKTYDIGSEGSSIFTNISNLETQLSQEQFKNEYYKNLKVYVGSEDYNDIVLPSGIGIEDAVLNRLIEDLILLQAERSQYLATQTASSPRVKEVSKKIGDLNKSINEVLSNTIDNSDRTLANLKKRLGSLETDFRKLPSTEQDLLRIQRSFTLNENIYTFLMQRRAEAAISMVSTSPPDKIMEEAIPNYLPLKLKPLTNYIVAVALGFILPLIIISIIIFSNNKVKNKKELESKLNNPVLTSIGHNRTKKNLIVVSKNKSAIAEAFRALRTNLTFIVPKEEKITIAVTSTIAGEGKSFTSMNLASAYAISEKRTVLVGCDLHKPKLYDDFKLTNAVGLSTYLSRQVNDLNAIIQKSSYPNLDLIAAGPTPPNPAELLISDRFEELIEKLKDNYDVIIFDTPPIGLTSETLSILKLAKVTLCVVRHNYSKLSFIEDINYLKEGKGFKNVYTVFNDVPSKDLNYGGYGYGYYSDDKAKGGVISKLFKGGRGQAAV
ncbi:sugar transporter [Echinicola pacifica]|uniref:non-specific protein-tyrosine kinase n=1 Tax=Echinicola pacifica TaxID=346377 RepID=A0A918PNH5_9BACT|nr:tyrosine-protein kinase family protein [Echinicola pacifica]GGZ14995.1 sugar transporter [Echinicola pacifica]